MARSVDRIAVLTGTLMGGYADDLFNVLYRLEPHKMVTEGYEWGESGVRNFAESYGVLERVTIIGDISARLPTATGRLVFEGALI
jgi:hypothetical protein